MASAVSSSSSSSSSSNREDDLSIMRNHFRDRNVRLAIESFNAYIQEHSMVNAIQELFKLRETEGLIDWVIKNLPRGEAELVDRDRNTLCHALASLDALNQDMITILKNNQLSLTSKNEDGNDPLDLLLGIGNYPGAYYLIRNLERGNLRSSLHDYFEIITKGPKLHLIGENQNGLSAFLAVLFGRFEATKEMLIPCAELLVEKVTHSDEEIEKYAAIVNVVSQSTPDFREYVREIVGQELPRIGNQCQRMSPQSEDFLRAATCGKRLRKFKEML